MRCINGDERDTVMQQMKRNDKGFDLLDVGSGWW